MSASRRRRAARCSTRRRSRSRASAACTSSPRFRLVRLGEAALAVEARWRSFKQIVRLWVDLFDRHSLLTYASAIALRMFIAAVACTLFALGILGVSHQEQLWRQTIGPAIEPKVLPHVFDGIDQTVSRVFSSSSVGLLALASALAVWEVSGIIRAGIGALDEIYQAPEQRPFWIRFPLSWGLAVLVLATMLGAIAIVWAGHVSGGWSIPI